MNGNDESCSSRRTVGGRGGPVEALQVPCGSSQYLAAADRGLTINPGVWGGGVGVEAIPDMEN